MDDLINLGLLLNAIGEKSVFPEDDVIDLQNGASSIPGDVTDARREGKKVIYNREKQEWIMPDGSIIK